LNLSVSNDETLDLVAKILQTTQHVLDVIQALIEVLDLFIDAALADDVESAQLSGKSALIERPDGRNQDDGDSWILLFDRSNQVQTFRMSAHVQVCDDQHREVPAKFCQRRVQVFGFLNGIADELQVPFYGFPIGPVVIHQQYQFFIGCDGHSILNLSKVDMIAIYTISFEVSIGFLTWTLSLFLSTLVDRFRLSDTR